MNGLDVPHTIHLSVAARPNMASSSDINQDFDSAPHRLVIPNKGQVLVC